MANQHTILPPVVIAGLYKQIVIPKEETAMLAEAQRASDELTESGNLDTSSIPVGTINATITGKDSANVSAGVAGSGPVRSATGATSAGEQMEGSDAVPLTATSIASTELKASDLAQSGTSGSTAVTEAEGSKVGKHATAAATESKNSGREQPAKETQTTSANAENSSTVQSATSTSTPVAKSAGTTNASGIAMEGKLPNTSDSKTETQSATGSTSEIISGNNASEGTAKDPAHIRTEMPASLENKIPESTISTSSSGGSNPSLSGTTLETISGNDATGATAQGSHPGHTKDSSLPLSGNTGGSTPVPGTSSPSSSSPYKILGKNLKHVVVIVRSPKEPFLPEDHLQFLTKMLSACQLNLGDVAIVNDATQKADIQALKAQLEPARLLLFGVKPAEIGLPLSFPQFKEQEYAGCSYLYSPSLLELNQTNLEARDLKKKLWECLKKMFNV